MSQSLYWNIVKNQTCLDTGLKFIIEKSYKDQMQNGFGFFIMDHEDLPYLQGVKDALNNKLQKEIQEMIDAIKEHGVIELRLG